jgi:glycosyltransferase involved in cell wall biosynthesis
MVATGHQVTMVCGSFGAGETGLTGPFVEGLRFGWVDGIEVYELELPYDNKQGFITRAKVFLLFALRTLRLLHRLKGADLLYATSTPLTVAVPALWARLVLRMPYVFEVRDLWPELPKAMGVVTNPTILFALGVLEWLAYRFAAACVGLSPGMVQGIKRRAPDAQVELIPNGCDLSLFQSGGAAGPSAESRNQAAALFGGFDPNQRNLIFAGTFGLANDLAQVLHAVRLAPELRGRVKVHLVGDGAQRESLVALSEQLGLQDTVKIHPSIPKEALAQTLCAFDGGLMILQPVPAFYYGTSPNKFFDYIAAGLPVVCNHPGWVADLLEEHQAGFSADGTIEDLSKALRDFADAPVLTLERMRLGSGRLASRFDRDVLVERQIRLCESVFSKSNVTL